jgi:hypothetical protein
MFQKSEVPAKIMARDYLERARRLRALASEATTAHVRVKLIETAAELERLGRGEVLEPKGESLAER